MRNIRLASAIACVLAGPLITSTAVAGAASADPMPAVAATVGQPVAEVFSPVPRAPKKVTVRVRCHKVKNDTPGNGESTELVEGVGRGKSFEEAKKLAEKDVDAKMGPGYHKRHCHVI